MKVSGVNIVSAIRGTDDDDRRQKRRKTNWKWVTIGIPSMIFPPLGIWFLFRKGFGLAWSWILAPIGIAARLLAMLGASKGSAELSSSLALRLLAHPALRRGARLVLPARRAA